MAEELQPLSTAPEDLFDDHLKHLQGTTASALTEFGAEVAVFYAGEPVHYHRDDIGQVFRPHASFARWTSGLDPERGRLEGGKSARLTYTPGHAVIFDVNAEKPDLFVLADPESPWYLSSEVPERTEEFFKVERFKTRDQLWEVINAKLHESQEVKHIGQPGDRPNVAMDSGAFMRRFEYEGLVKTPFEIAAIRRANERTADGHRAALKSFLDGRSEGEILSDFVRAAKQREVYHSYPAIVAIGAHGAALHYEGVDWNFTKGSSLLVDAGTTDLWYPADVTTTYLRKGAPKAFIDLVAGVDKIQKELVDSMRDGVKFAEVQSVMMVMLGQLLIDVGVLRNCTAREAAEKRYVHAFCPHSVGHSLGIQTHDKGQHVYNEDGSRALYGKEDSIVGGGFRKHDFAENQVVTVEPGIYFIGALLDKFRGNPDFDWTLLDKLEGGIRIETDVWITRRAVNGHVDLTRLALPEGTNV